MYVMRILWRQHQWQILTSFMKFSFVGVVTTAFNFCLFLIFLHSGFHYLIALLVAWAMSLALGFSLNRFLTFQVPYQISSGEVARYAVATLFHLILALAGFVVLIDGMGIPPALAYPINLSFVAVCNFSVMRFLVYPLQQLRRE